MVGKNKTQNGLLNKSSELKDRKSKETYKEKDNDDRCLLVLFGFLPTKMVHVIGQCVGLHVLLVSQLSKKTTKSDSKHYNTNKKLKPTQIYK